MIKKSFLYGIIVSACMGALLIFNSCNKEKTDLTKNNDKLNSEIQLKDGVLNFSTVEDFFAMSEKLGNMTEGERDIWENNLGFKSLRTELNLVFDAVSEIESEEELNMIVNSNKDIVKIQDGEIVPIIESNAYAAISDRAGIFYVDNVVHKVEGGRIASSEDGNISTVTNALYSDLKVSQDGVNVIDYMTPSSTLKSGGCGTIMTAFVEANKRKCDFLMKTYPFYCAGCCGNFYWQVKAESEIRNYAKSLNKWKSYDTQCEMKNRAYTISAPIVTGFNGTHSTFYYANITHTFAPDYSNYDCAIMTRWTFVGDQVQNSSISTPVFLRVKGEASNRGVGDSKWAKINCGAW